MIVSQATLIVAGEIGNRKNPPVAQKRTPSLATVRQWQYPVAKPEQ
jgi:hypothetical protein